MTPQVDRASRRDWSNDAGLECQYCNCEEQINVSQMCKTPQRVKNVKMAAIFFSQLSLWLPRCHDISHGYHVVMTMSVSQFHQRFHSVSFMFPKFSLSHRFWNFHLICLKKKAKYILKSHSFIFILFFKSRDELSGKIKHWIVTR